MPSSGEALHSLSVVEVPFAILADPVVLPRGIPHDSMSSMSDACRSLSFERPLKTQERPFCASGILFDFLRILLKSAAADVKHREPAVPYEMRIRKIFHIIENHP